VRPGPGRAGLGVPLALAVTDPRSRSQCQPECRGGGKWPSGSATGASQPEVPVTSVGLGAPGRAGGLGRYPGRLGGAPAELPESQARAAPPRSA
jgi:hypothetical protein